MVEPAGLVLGIFSQLDTTVDRLRTRIKHQKQNKQKILSITQLFRENAETYEGCRQAMMENPDPSGSNLHQLRITHIENIKNLAIDTLQTLKDLEKEYFRDEQGVSFSKRQRTKIRCFVRANKIHSTLCVAETAARDVQKVLNDLRSELTIERRIDAMPRESTGPGQSVPATVIVENPNQSVLNFGTINGLNVQHQGPRDV